MLSFARGCLKIAITFAGGRVARVRLPDKEMEERIAALLQLNAGTANRDLLHDIVSTASLFGRDDVTRLELKIVSRALQELRDAFRVFAPHRGKRKVSVFGSARTPPATPLYDLAVRTGREAVRQGMMVITGAGPGVMEAANIGAGLEGSFGLNIRLPFEPQANAYVRPDRLMDFKYFFTRKLTFVKESDAFILFPGGFGTNDECFELLTLLQTGKGELCPVVLLDLPEGTYWKTWLDFVRSELARGGYVDESDLELLMPADSVEEALRTIRDFYKLYNSSRYVGDWLMMRLERPLTDGELDALAREFSDIIVPGSLERSPAVEEERADPFLRRLSPIRFRFDRRRFSRLKLMIDAINRFEPSAAEAGPAAPVVPPSGAGGHAEDAGLVW